MQILSNDIQAIKQAVACNDMQTLLTFNGITKRNINSILNALESKSFYKTSDLTSEEMQCQNKIIETLRGLGYETKEINAAMDETIIKSELSIEEKIADVIRRIALSSDYANYSSN